MAFHALVNVLRLYEAVARLGGAEAQYVAANAPALRRDIAVLRKPLTGNPALTAFGRSLYEPLAEVCDELDV
jgi:HEXXH motif-containing protein